MEDKILIELNEPRTKWAKERLKMYGPIFCLERFEAFRGENAAYVKSRDGKWFGWFTESEVNWKLI